MPLVNVYNTEGKNLGEVELKNNIFEVPVVKSHLHMAVEKQLRNKRAGTACTKTRAEVRGGGRKPWKQKGTGRARHGSTRSPIWKGGGVTFGPRPRDYSIKLPQKMRRLALCEALSSKLQDGKIKVVEEIKMEKISTKEFVRVMKDLELSGKVLFVFREHDDLVQRSARNIRGVMVVRAKGLSVYDILYHDYLVFLKDALQYVEEVLS